MAKDADLVYTNFKTLREDKDSVNGYERHEGSFIKYQKWQGYDKLISRGNICGQVFLLSKRIIKKVGMFHRIMFTDYDYAIRVAEETDRVQYVSDVLYHMRSHMQSHSSILQCRKGAVICVKIFTLI